jgi:imidazolonepropionase-like amidohydrolase
VEDIVPESIVRPALAITGVTLIDGSDTTPLPDRSVVIERDRFTAVGPVATTPLPPGAAVIDGRGKYLMPGLVDMHVHVYTPEKWHPELFLAAGVTRTLDLGGQVEHVAAYRAAIGSGARRGPWPYFTGPMLEENAPFKGFASFSRQIDAARVEAEVDALADAGVDGIKLYVTVRPETAQRACRRARERNLPVFMHQHATWGAEAATAGVRCVEHLNVFGGLAPEAQRPADPGRLTPFEYGGLLWKWLADVDPRSDDVHRLYESLISADTAIDPTLVLYSSRPGALGDDVGDTSMDDPERTPLLPLVPPAVADELVTRWAERRGAARGASARAREATRRAWQIMLQLIGGFHDTGGVVLAGTDCPNVAIVSGYSLHRELELLVRAGLSTRHAIAAATRRPAERLGKRDVFGTIAVGREADALLLSADPLADIRNTRRIERVIARGVVYEPQALLDSLGVR